MKTSLAYQIMGYDLVEGEGSNMKFLGSTMINVFAQTESEALQKAKKLIKKNSYYISSVSEMIMPHNHIDDMRKQPWEK